MGWYQMYIGVLVDLMNWGMGWLLVGPWGRSCPFMEGPGCTFFAFCVGCVPLLDVKWRKVKMVRFYSVGGDPCMWSSSGGAFLCGGMMAGLVDASRWSSRNQRIL